MLAISCSTLSPRRGRFWRLISIGTDSGAKAEDGPLSESKSHPRAWGSFPRILGKYVRDEKLIPLEEAIRRFTSRPAARVGLADRGNLRPGLKADITVFDPARIRDVSTFIDPTHYSEGVQYVLVNGKAVVFTATAATVANVTAGLVALLNATTAPPEHQEITWANITTALTGTADTPGKPFTQTSSSVGGTLTTAVTTANKSSNDVNDAQNWSLGTVPANGEDVYIQDTDKSLLYNLSALSAVTHWDERCGTAVTALTLAVAALVRGEPSDASVQGALIAVEDQPGGEELEFLVDAIGESRAIDGPDQGFCLFAAGAALQAPLRHPTFEAGVLGVIALGGDTGANAAAAGALLGAIAGASGLPGGWLDRLPHRSEIEAEAEALAVLAELESDPR